MTSVVLHAFTLDAITGTGHCSIVVLHHDQVVERGERLGLVAKLERLRIVVCVNHLKLCIVDRERCERIVDVVEHILEEHSVGERRCTSAVARVAGITRQHVLKRAQAELHAPHSDVVAREGRRACIQFDLAADDVGRHKGQVDGIGVQRG